MATFRDVILGKYAARPGETFWDRGRLCTFVKEEPTARGRAQTWRTKCARCGEQFECSTSAGILERLRRECFKHSRRPMP